MALCPPWQAARTTRSYRFKPTGNERPGPHPLDALGEFASTVIVELRPVTPSQLVFIPGEVFSQAINQPSMQLVNIYLVERFRRQPELG